MAGYQKPGILITEVESPNTTIVVDRPTVVSIVGKARGNEVRTEVLRLVDNDEVTLAGVNAVTSPASSFVVRDINRLNTEYVQGSSSDYTLYQDAEGVTTIKRTIYTTISSTEKVVAVLKTVGGSGAAVESHNVAFDYNNSTAVVSVSNGGTVDLADDVMASIQKAGKYALTTDYTVNSSNGRITRANSSYGPNDGDCHIMSGQKVYVSYTTNDGANIYTDEQVTLTGTSASALAGEGDTNGVDISSIVVRNKTGLGSSATAVDIFVSGTNGNSGVDFEFDLDTGSSLNAAEAFTMARNTDSPGVLMEETVVDNRVDVRVEYQYIPTEYYSPTLFASYQELEAKYGPAFDSNGDVATPLSAAAYMCFGAGSNEIIAQPLFSKNNNGTRVAGDETNSSDWATTLEALRGQTAINVLVPAVGQNASIDDDALYAIFMKFSEHIEYMQQDNEYIVAIFGEDSTTTSVSNSRASMATLQQHAQQLGQRTYPERTVLVSPASFTVPNPKTGQAKQMGGQYVAAKIAGMLGRYPVQSSMTRKSVPGVSDASPYRNSTEKDQDAGYGLMVVENNNGIVRVRHAITTAVGDANKRELNAMRSKFFMIETVKNTLDTNVLGKIIADNRAPFIVSSMVSGSLEYLRNTGAIAGYSNVSATPNSTSPTSMVVRFTYSLPYAINNIEVALSLDSTTGTISAL
jgi:hypothetical protein